MSVAQHPFYNPTKWEKVGFLSSATIDKALIPKWHAHYGSLNPQMLTLLNTLWLWNAFGHWEEFYKSCKATQCATPPLTHVDGPACFCKPHCGIRTFIKAMISFLQCCIYCIPGVLQVHDLSILSLATIPCKQFLFCAGETNTPPINCFTAEWGTGSCSLDNKTACFLWPWSYNFHHNNLKLNNISYGIK